MSQRQLYRYSGRGTKYLIVLNFEVVNKLLAFFSILFGHLLLREAEAAVGAEVELRLAAACSNRGLWPRPIREEVERLEQRLGGLQVGSGLRRRVMGAAGSSCFMNAKASRPWG